MGKTEAITITITDINKMITEVITRTVDITITIEEDMDITTTTIDITTTIIGIIVGITGIIGMMITKIGMIITATDTKRLMIEIEEVTETKTIIINGHLEIFTFAP